MTEKEVLFIFEELNALLKGHFRLSSGLHSEKYLQCAIVLQYPVIAEKLAKALAARFEGEKVDAVIGPALGGVTWAYEVARALGAKGLFTEREEGRMTLRRGFSIKEGEKVLVVEDVVTTGGSTKEVLDIVKGCGGVVIGVGSVIDRSDKPVDFGVRFKSLAKIKVQTFKEDSCPLCKAGTPLTKPGSRK
jgi:orotate phosphoribosyltransferase